MLDAVLQQPTHRPKTDPARFEVVKNALYSAAEEMKIVLAKRAYSPLLKVAGDYSCGIFDAAGNMVAAGAGSGDPFGLDAGCGVCGDCSLSGGRVGRCVHPQRPLLGGSHLPDVNVVAPAFVSDASIAVKWVVPEHSSERAPLLHDYGLVAPDLLFAECANILWKKVRRGELTKEEADIAAQTLEETASLSCRRGVSRSSDVDCHRT
jgi:Hydantoinase B/oxoprolinase